MKETTLLNNISKLVNKINYESVYVEIRTKNDKYILEKNNERKIGFEIGGKLNGKKMDKTISNRVYQKSKRKRTNILEC